MSKEVCINVVLGAIETTGISVVVYGLRRVQRACGFTTVTNRRVYCPAVGMAIGGDADGVCEWREVQCVRLEIVQQHDVLLAVLGLDYCVVKPYQHWQRQDETKARAACGNAQ